MLLCQIRNNIRVPDLKSPVRWASFREIFRKFFQKGLPFSPLLNNFLLCQSKQSIFNNAQKTKHPLTTLSSTPKSGMVVNCSSVPILIALPMVFNAAINALVSKPVVSFFFNSATMLTTTGKQKSNLQKLKMFNKFEKTLHPHPSRTDLLLDINNIGVNKIDERVNGVIHDLPSADLPNLLGSKKRKSKSYNTTNIRSSDLCIKRIDNQKLITCAKIFWLLII